MNALQGLIGFQAHERSWFGAERNWSAIESERVGVVVDADGVCQRVVWGGENVQGWIGPGETLYVLARDFGVTLSQPVPCADRADVVVTWAADLRLLDGSENRESHPLVHGMALGLGGAPVAFERALCDRVASVFHDCLREFFRPLRYSERNWDEEALRARLRQALEGQPNLGVAFQPPPARGAPLKLVYSPSADTQAREELESRQRLEALRQEETAKEELRRLTGRGLQSQGELDLLAEMVPLQRRHRLEMESLQNAAKVLAERSRVEFLQNQIDLLRHRAEMERRADEARAEQAEIEREKARLELRVRERALTQGEPQPPPAELAWKRYEIQPGPGAPRVQALPMSSVLPGGSFLQLEVQARQLGWFYLLALGRRENGGEGRPGARYAWETLFANDHQNTLNYAFRRPRFNRLEAGEHVVLPQDGGGADFWQRFWRLDNAAGGHEYLYALFCPRPLTDDELAAMRSPVGSPSVASLAAASNEAGSGRGGPEEGGWDPPEEHSRRTIESMRQVAPAGSLIREYVIFHS